MRLLQRARAKQAAFVGVCCGVLAGCGPRVDMSGVYEPTQAHTTIAYEGVQEESRLYPDYGAIRGDILAPGAQSQEAP